MPRDDKYDAGTVLPHASLMGCELGEGPAMETLIVVAGFVLAAIKLLRHFGVI